MLKEADVSRKGLLAFRECLSVVSSLTIDSIEELPAKDIPDYQAIVRGEGFKQIIYLEVNYHPLKQVVFWRHFYNRQVVSIIQYRTSRKGVGGLKSWGWLNIRIWTYRGLKKWKKCGRMI